MQCRICGSTEEHRSYNVKEMMMGNLDEFNYFQCSTCHCLQIAAVPDNLSEHYPDNYYSYVAPNTGSGLKQTLIRMRDQYAATGKNPIGKLLQTFSPNAKLTTLRPLALNNTSRVLDVGCGAGLLLHSLREIGLQNILGIDPFNDDNIEYDNGLKIEQRDIFSEESEWDVIMFHHSFEHLPEQQATLKKVHQQLAPEGTALIRVPTVSSYAWQHYGVNWVQLDAPRHLFLHSVESVTALAEQCGFKVEQVLYDSNAFQFWGSEQYEKGIMLRDQKSWAENPAQSMFTPAQVKSFENEAHRLNSISQGDQAAFYLRKVA